MTQNSVPLVTVNKSSKIDFVLWNCNGIRGKTHILDYLLMTNKPDIFALTETKLDNTVSDNEISTDYTIYRRDRRNGLGPGGGVLIGVSNICPISVLNVQPSDNGELLQLDISVNGISFVLCVYYRRPVIRSVDDIIHWYSNIVNPNTIILGDFNLPGINWNDKSVKPNATDKQMCETFLDFANSNDFATPITFPTYQSGNTLDLILTTLDIDNLDFEPGFSDHHVIKFQVPFNTHIDRTQSKSPNSMPFFKFNKADITAIANDCHILHQTVADAIEELLDIDYIWNTFKRGVLDTAFKNIPHKTRTRRHKFWITAETKRNINRRKRWYKVMRLYPDFYNTSRYDAQNKLCKYLVNRDYNNYLNQHICDRLDSGDTKPLYTFISNKKGTSNNINQLDGCPSNSVDIADCFADAFVSVFSIDDGISIDPTNSNPPDLSESVLFDSHGVLRQLQTLDTRKGAGPDMLSPALLKFLAPHIYQTLTNIFQYSYDKHQVPTDWRTAHVVPIFKKGKKTDPLNYRPISLTSIVCKIFEHILAHNIHAHLNQHTLLYEHQHGFRPGHGCDTQLLNTITDFIDNFDNGIPLDVIILDFSKAFDVVSHTKLIDKLPSFGIHPNTVDWIASWLKNRKLVVTVNGARSSPREVTSGVPQGSCLGPLLFLLYINCMPDKVQHSVTKLYADDSLLYKPIHDPVDEVLLQTDLDSLLSWAESNQMNFNVTKCEHARITRGQDTPSISYKMNDTPLKTVNTFKYLGVNIDCKLKFGVHIIEICRKASNILYMLMRSLKRARQRTRATAYKTLCRPILEYASHIWSPHLAKLKKVLENINRKAFRWCFNKKKHDRISDLMLLHDWSDLETRRANIDRRLFSRIIADDAAVDKNKFLPHHSEHNTRHGATRFHINTDVRKYSFQMRALKFSD